LADLALGPDDGGYNEMVLLGNRLFFTARPVFPGYYDLYATTGSGVQKLSGSLKSAGNLTRVGSTIYFEGSTFSGNTELWKVTEDGVPERVASILPMQFYVIDKGAWNNQLFFSAGDPVHGYELWISDGSQAGTKMLADLNTQTLPSGADIYGLTAVYKGAVYFGASSGFDYNGLWRSDGTAAGTEQVDTIHSRPIWEGMQDSAVSNDFLYYTGVNRADGNIGLWRTDGTSEGTVELMDNTWPHRFMDANGRLFFISQNEVSLNMGLWVLNKGETIPTMVMETNATQLGALGSDCLLVAWVDNGWELWRTDGTSGGTYLIDAKTSSWSFSQDYLFNQLEEMVSFDGRLFFIAPSEGISDTAALYATDGSTITQISAAQATPLFPTQPVVAGNSLYFGGMNGQDSVIWKLTAGSDEATVIHTAATGLESYSEYRVPIPLTNLNGKLVFRSDPQEENGDLLWLSDGTSQGTAPICPDCSYRVCSCEAPVVANGKMYFAASDTQSLQGNELWVSDGSAAGTKLLADILPGPGSSDPANLIVLGQKLLFTATDGTEAGTDHGYELWRYDLDPIYTFLPLIRR
jgi:ELWxxDGT repeat protein